MELGLARPQVFPSQLTVTEVLVAVTDVAAGALGATEARAEALMTMGRSGTGQRDLSLAAAEDWWAAQRDEMGLRSRWPLG